MRLVLTLLCSSLLGATGALAQPLKVDITEGASAPLQISLAAASRVNEPGGGAPVASLPLLEVIQADLASTGLYNLVRHESAGAGELADELKAARTRTSQGLVWFNAALSSADTLRAECAYLDVYSGAVEASAAFSVPAAQARRAAHKCADLVFAHTSGEPGYFDTQFAVITDSGTPLAPQRRVTILDSDGFNLRYVSAPGMLTATPALSRDGKLSAYIGIADGVTKLVVLDRTTGAERRIEAPGALLSMPAFAPDGRTLLVTMSREGNADIVRYDLVSGNFTALTNAFGADTAATFAPDGSKIVFQSDRSGQPQIYVMNPDGSDQRRLSFGDGSFANPAWSPRGDRIAFTFITDGAMQIGTMRADGSALRLLPAPWQDESPTWAASGTLLAFTRTTRTEAPQLWISDLTGKRQRRLPVPMAATEPSWSGLLP